MIHRSYADGFFREMHPLLEAAVSLLGHGNLDDSGELGFELIRACLKRVELWWQSSDHDEKIYCRDAKRKAAGQKLAAVQP